MPPRPPADGSPDIQSIAATLHGQVSALADGMLEHLAQHIPEIAADAELRGLTLGSCSSNLEAVLSMIRHGIDVSAAEAPATALEHARAMASRGHSVDVMLRFYRLGQQYFTATFAEVTTATLDPADAWTIFIEFEQFGFRYIDRISTLVASEYVAELDRRQHRDRAERSDVVHALLAGEQINLRRAEAVLGHPLTGRQVGFVCWSEDRSLDLAGIAQRVAIHIGAERALVIADGSRAVWGWVAMTSDPVDRVRSLRLTDDVHLAVGSEHRGATGFRDTHLQALRARRLVDMAGSATPSVTLFSDIALVDVLSQDMDALRAFVTAELGELARDDARSQSERAALLALLTAQGSLKTAAEALGVHRNTVLQRVRRAEVHIGAPASARLAEVHAALRACDVLGASVLQRP